MNIMMDEAHKPLLLVATLVCLAVLSAVQGISWIDRTAKGWEAKAKAQETIHHEVTTLAAQLKPSHHIGKVRKSIPETDTIVSLLTWLERETAAFQLTDKIQQISPVPGNHSEANAFREKANLSLKAISMETAIRFLYRLESTPQVRIIRGEIKRADKDTAGIILYFEIGLL
ncbi:MAG: hypothetical protein H7833_12075 [Magnetococcus sp. DMHC-1]|nr:hypothetical protein [Magnetococcales bacterium]